MINALSIDLEDCYHICGIEDIDKQDEQQESYIRLEESTERILLLLKQYNICATFFVVGVIAKNAPKLIKKIANAGHELAVHGFSHRRIFDMTPEEFEEDLLQAKVAVEEAAGKKVSGYRAPEWSLKKNNLWALDILKRHGFSYDASAVPLSHLGGKHFDFYPHEIKTKYGNMLEFPLSTFRCFWERLPFSGGLSMRITPYFYILDCVRMINNLGYPTMFYLHTWEFDTKHVEIELPANRKFMHYCNLKSTAKKAKLLLGHLEFSTVEDVLRLQGQHSSKASFYNKNNKYCDMAYFKSMVLSLFCVLSVCLMLFGVTFLIKQYIFLLLVIIGTIFYWPWGLLFQKNKTLLIKNE